MNLDEPRQLSSLALEDPRVVPILGCTHGISATMLAKILSPMVKIHWLKSLIQPHDKKYKNLTKLRFPRNTPKRLKPSGDRCMPKTVWLNGPWLKTKAAKVLTYFRSSFQWSEMTEPY